jgi:hypothetical protein
VLRARFDRIAREIEADSRGLSGLRIAT